MVSPWCCHSQEEEERKRVEQRRLERERELEEKAKREELERRGAADAARLAARERAGKSWAAEEEEEEEEEKEEPIERAPEKRVARNDESWKEHRLGGGRQPPREVAPPRGGDRWEGPPRVEQPMRSFEREG